ncbi:MAG: calcium-binding protein, partial [Planctomycetes bacterium]|nr:calcium-binding protein [Planctomycetota bacterium]
MGILKRLVQQIGISKGRHKEPLLLVEPLERRLLLDGDGLLDVPISDQVRDTFLDGLQEVESYVDSLENHEQVNQVLPFVAQSIGQSLNPSDIFHTHLYQPISNYFASDATPTTGELVDVIKNLGGNFGNLNLNIDPSQVTGGLSPGLLGDQLEFNIVLEGIRIEESQLDFSFSDESLRLQADAGATIDLTTNLGLDVTFGVELSEGLSNSDAFFTKFGNMSLSAQIETSDLNCGLDFGFLGIQTQGGQIDLDASLSVSFNNPDVDAEEKITATELLGTTIEDLIAINPISATVTGSMPIHVDIPGLSISGGTLVEISGNPFSETGVDSLLNGSDASELNNFMRVGESNVAGVLDNVGGWLEQVSDSQVFNNNIPLIAGGSFNEMVDFGEAFKQRVLDDLKSELGIPVFSNAQELADHLATLLGVDLTSIDLKYNRYNNTLGYTINLNELLANDQVPVSLDLDMSPLGDVITNGIAQIQASGKVDFTILIDLSPFEAQVTSEMPLPVNGKLFNNAVFYVSVNGDEAKPVTVVKNTDNVLRSQLLSQINQALVDADLAEVTAGEYNGRLILTVHGLMQSQIIVTADAADPAVNELGLDTFMAGHDNLARHTMLDDVSLRATADVDAVDIELGANFGFAGIGITGGVVDANALIDVTLRDPGSPNSPILLSELYKSISNIDSYSIVNTDGSATITLPNITVNSGLNIVTGDNPEITVTISTLMDNPNVIVTHQDLGDLIDFKVMTFHTVIGLLRDVQGWLKEVEDSGKLDIDLLVTDKRLTDFVKPSEELGKLIDKYEADPAKSIQEVEAKLRNMLGLAAVAAPSSQYSTNADPPPSGMDIQTEFKDKVFTAAITYPYSYIAQLPFHLHTDLSDLGLDPAFASLVELGGSGNINVDLNTNTNLVVGVDLNNMSVKPFIHDSTDDPLTSFDDATKIDVSIIIDGSNLNFNAVVGSLGLYFKDGTARVDDGTSARNPAKFKVALNEKLDNHRYDGFSQLFTLTTYNLDGTGIAEATLPVYYPATAPEDFQGNIEFLVSDLSDPLNTTTLAGPNLGSLLADVDLLEVLDQGIDLILHKLDEALDIEIFGIRLPMVGNALQNAVTFMSDLYDDPVSGLNTTLIGAASLPAVQSAIFQSFGPDGFNILTDRQDDGDDQIDINDIEIPINTADQIQFDMKLAQTLFELTIPVGFNIGLPALGLSVDESSSVKFMVGYDFDFSFGIEREEGVYLNTAVTDELTINFAASIPNLAAGGTLGFLQLNVTDNTTDPSHFTGSFTVDIEDPVGTNNHLTLNELISSTVGISEIIADVDLVANADINLDFITSLDVSGYFPSLQARFNLDWNFDETTNFDGELQEIGFSEVKINLGEFFDTFVDPIIGQISNVLDPIHVITDALTHKVDLVIKSLSIMDLLKMRDPASYGAAMEFIEAVDQITELVNYFDSVGGDTWIDLGSFTLDLDDSNLSTIGSTTNPSVSLNNQLATEAPTFHGASSEVNGGLSFPIIEESSNVFQLLLGGNPTLFSYDMPTMRFADDFEYWLGTIPIGPIPVSFTLGGGYNMSFDFNFGYDTEGLRRAIEQDNLDALIDGFFVYDVNENGQDIPEVTLSARVFATAAAGGSIDFGFIGVGARAGVEGGLLGEAFADLHDHDGDGKIRASEFMEYYFDLSGRLGFYIDAFAEVTAKFLWFEETERWSETLVDVTLVDFGSGARGSKDWLNPPVLAELDSETGTLYLNMGPRAGQRVANGEPYFEWMVFDFETGIYEKFRLNYSQKHGPAIGNDGDEIFEVRRNGNGTVIVGAFGFEQIYGLDGIGGVEITKIVADGGEGNDQIFVANEVWIDADLRGGAGNDTIVGGGGIDLIQGDAGADILTGNSGDDFIYGHNETNTNDDDGDDVLVGKRGEDFLEGGGGADIILGGRDDDEIYGGTGDDYLYGNQGEDQLFGEVGADYLFGHSGKDYLYGGIGDDYLFGNEADDQLFGGSGADTLVGGADNDVLYGHDELAVDDDNAFDVLWGDFALGAPMQDIWQNDNEG